MLEEFVLVTKALKLWSTAEPKMGTDKKVAIKKNKETLIKLFIFKCKSPWASNSYIVF
jgi:hypothetical protein